MTLPITRLSAGDKILPAGFDGGRAARRRARDVPEAADIRRNFESHGVVAGQLHGPAGSRFADATKQRYADWNELMTYCRYSASPVGRQLLDLHGEGPGARAIGRALRCTPGDQPPAGLWRGLCRDGSGLCAPGPYGGQWRGTRSSAGENGQRGLRRTLNSLLDGTDRLMLEARNLPANLEGFPAAL